MLHRHMTHVEPRISSQQQVNSICHCSTPFLFFSLGIPTFAHLHLCILQFPKARQKTAIMTSGIPIDYCKSPSLVSLLARYSHSADAALGVSSTATQQEIRDAYKR